MRRLFALLMAVGMLVLPACNIFTKPGNDDTGGNGDTGTTGPIDSFWVIILLDSIRLPDSITGYTLWSRRYRYGPGESIVFDQAFDRSQDWTMANAFVGVGAADTQYGWISREIGYVGSEGSDTLFAGFAPAPFGPVGWHIPEDLPDTMDLRWFCLAVYGPIIEVYTTSGDTGYDPVFPEAGPNDSLLYIWLNDRTNYPWWRPFVLTNDTLVIGVGVDYGMDGSSLVFKSGCTGPYAGLYYRIISGGQEVVLP